MAKIEDLLLLGMLNDAVIDKNLLYYEGFPVCYSSEIEGGYCLIVPGGDYFKERDYQRLPGGLVLVPSIIDFLVEVLYCSAAASAIHTDYSSRDVPEIRKRMEKQLIGKTENENFFWLEEFADYYEEKPIQTYPSGLRRISYLSKGLTGLLSGSDKKREMVSKFCVSQESYHRGVLSWSTEVDVEERKKLLQSEALKGYDCLLAKHLRYANSRTVSYDEEERVRKKLDSVRFGIDVFCGLSSFDKPNLRTLIGRTTDKSLIEIFADLHYDGNQEALLKDLEEFKQKLVAEHS